MHESDHASGNTDGTDENASDEIRRRILGFGERSFQKSYYPELQARIRELEKALREKDALLKEVHHRVKNNLQIISSLFDLQRSIGVKGQSYESVLESARNRIRSMAIVHEKLYQHGEFSLIELDDYISTIADTLFRNYYTGGLQLEKHLDTCTVCVEKAIPVGLILNELLTNAFKFAYPQSEGVIRLELVVKTGRIRLIITDYGTGFDRKRLGEGLGTRLVMLLADQLSATVEWDFSDGTWVRLDMPAVDECEPV